MSDEQLASDERNQRRTHGEESGGPRLLRRFWYEGVMWMVYERFHGQADHRSARLVFDCGLAMRTLRQYPANWPSLTDEELVALSQVW